MTSKLAALASAAALMLLALPASAQQSLPPGSFQVAAGTCTGMFSTCAARCKQRAPQDKNCVADHCSPKLAACRQTGCWQEGAMYGGGKTCGLGK